MIYTSLTATSTRNRRARATVSKSRDAFRRRGARVLHGPPPKTGGSMVEFNNRHPGHDEHEDIAGDIARFESMSSAEIDAQLAKYGIDPAQTIAVVTEIVRAKLAEYRPTAKKKH
jgi:hypothetical protein